MRPKILFQNLYELLKIQELSKKTIKKQIWKTLLLN